MSEEITLDKEVFKALAGDTRIAVVKALLERRKTQSELAKELGLAAPTIKDHVDILMKAGLVREIETGHKWKYIELTVKGKSLLQPSDKRILVLLGTSLVGIVGAGFLAMQSWTNQVNQFASETAPMAVGKMAVTAGDTFVNTTLESGAEAPLMDAVATSAPVPTAEIAMYTGQAAVQLIPNLPLSELAIMVLCLIVFGISVGMWIKQTY
ncbi:MAG: winged helix-turn-helix domain-containing protein [archaeon]